MKFFSKNSPEFQLSVDVLVYGFNRKLRYEMAVWKWPFNSAKFSRLDQYLIVSKVRNYERKIMNFFSKNSSEFQLSIDVLVYGFNRKLRYETAVWKWPFNSAKFSRLDQYLIVSKVRNYERKIMNFFSKNSSEFQLFIDVLIYCFRCKLGYEMIVWKMWFTNVSFNWSSATDQYLIVSTVWKSTIE